MNVARFRGAGIAGLAVLLISGAGIAFAGNTATEAPTAAPAATPTVAPVVEPATNAADPAAEPVEMVDTVDTDTLEEGDQTTADSPADQADEGAGTETESAGTEKSGAEEAGDANLPGGGHADDPNDPNADHQFEGVE